MGQIGSIGFYGILTDPEVGYEELARVMVDKGVSLIQLRMKDAPSEQVLRMAHRLRAIIGGDSRFIVNDDPEIARQCGADGVHLGQDDMSIEEARRILGPSAIIGLSTHNPVQTVAACSLEPDYIGVGPVFATPTKKHPDPVIGLDGMVRMLEVATVPAVCIGGIDLVNAASVLEAGARNICAVRCINGSPTPGRQLDQMLSLIQAAG